MKGKVSIKDIAKAVGVSTALVSYVLNGKEKEARVGKQIAEKIRQVAGELNYQPNQIARSLKIGKTHTIGLVVADISNPFFANIARTIEDEAKKSNYTVIFGSSDENPEKLHDLIEVLINRQVDGLIIVPTFDSESQIIELQNRKMPFVLIDRYFKDLSTNCVVTDNYQASYDAVLHLIRSGYRKIGMIAYNVNLVHMAERERGYRDALKDHNLLPEVPLIGEVSYSRVKEDVERSIEAMVFSESVDALFFATNTLAVNGLNCINRLGIKVPDNLAVVTFDEGEVFDFFYSPLTFVQQPIVQLGQKAVELLLAEINSGVPAGNQQVCVSSRLIIRSSSQPAKNQVLDD